MKSTKIIYCYLENSQFHILIIINSQSKFKNKLWSPTRQFIVVWSDLVDKKMFALVVELLVTDNLHSIEP